MKKFMTTLAVLLCGNFALFAGSDEEITVTSGDPIVIHTPGLAYVVVDYSKATVGDLSLDKYLASRGEDYVRDWPEDQEKIRQYFTVRMNQKNKKGLRTTEDKDEAEYIITIHVKDIDTGDAGSQFIPFASPKAGGVIFTSDIDIKEKASGKKVLTISAKDVKGMGHFSMTTRFGMAFHELANKLVKL